MYLCSLCHALPSQLFIRTCLQTCFLHLPHVVMQREHRSLVCDVFESASRGAAAAFISSQVQSPAGDVVHSKLQQQSVDAARGRQTSAMLFMCAIACVYEVTCRHWKLVRLSYATLAAVSLIVSFRLLLGGSHWWLVLPCQLSPFCGYWAMIFILSCTSICHVCRAMFVL